MNAQRALVVAEALSWLRTPYHHRGRLKGVGVDCAQLPLCVYANVGLLEAFDTGEYPPDWHQHREEERYAGVVLEHALEITAAEVAPGDLILWKFGRAFSHGAIVVSLPTVIHAERRAGCVMLTEIDQDDQLAGRPARYFSFWKSR